MKPEEIAICIMNGSFEHDAMLGRLKEVIHAPAFLRKLVDRIIETFGRGRRPSLKTLSDWLKQDKKFLHKQGRGFIFLSVSIKHAEMAPDMRAAAIWKIPSITSVGSLCDWLEIEYSQIDWYAGAYGKVSVNSSLSHYKLREMEKRSGGMRILEIPKWDMKGIQRRILHGILDHIPPHFSSHGFQKNRSILTYVRPHIGKRVLVKLDLENYFLSVKASRVRALFHLAGYPPNVSRLLAELCTHAMKKTCVPQGAQQSWKYEQAHLPQGAPSSPALADRLLFRLDIRLQGLAKKMDFSYTRYADDMAFSTDDVMFNGRRVDSFIQLVNRVINEEGFYLNTQKTRVMHASQRQRLAGLVVNIGTNLERSEYDRLRATLHRCVLNGLESENRYAHPSFYNHLCGRVEFVRSTHQARGEKLFRVLRMIAPLNK